MSSRNGNTRGFTIIELMVTFVILAVLAAMAAPLAKVAAQRTKEQELRTSLRQIRDAIDAYKQMSDEGRIVKNAGDSGYPETLQVLVDGVEDIKDPKKEKIYFLRKILSDPMYVGKATQSEETWGMRSYQSPADRPEPGRDVFDVHSLSSDVGLNEIPYNEW